MLSTHLRHRNCNIESAFAVKFEVKFIPNPATHCAAVVSSSLLSKVWFEGRSSRSPVQQALIYGKIPGTATVSGIFLLS